MGLISNDCEVCSGRNIHFGGLVGHFIAKYTMCRHCHRTMCKKCNKGPLCKTCFFTLPKNLQTNCNLTNWTTLGIGLIFLGILFYGMLFGFIPSNQHLSYDVKVEMTLEYSLIGFLGMIGSLILRSIILTIWYNKNKNKIP